MKNLIIRRIALFTTLALIVPAIVSCSSKSKIEGTYSQSGSGTVALDLKSGGKATFTMMGDDYPCIYKVNGDKVSVDCSPKGEKIDFTIHDDGSLTGPSFIGVLKKSK
ncbi:MAG: hypothetical protein QOH31_4652 [Verrucomicrobiota bacterium]|jgi:hypothetical protein